MQTLANIWNRWTLGTKFLINISLAIVIFLTVLAARNPVLPKAAAYNLLREAVKKSLYFKTWGWHTLESDHFVIKYQDSDANVAELVLSAAEQAYVPVGEALQYSPVEKIPLVIYPDKASLNRSFGWDADENAMGVYWAGVIRILSPNDWVENREDMAQEFIDNGPIAHEYTHLVVDYITRGNYPRWLTEGVAQYLEREVTGFQFPETQVDDINRLYDLKEMDATFDALPDQALAYSQSLAAADYYVERYGFAALRILLADLGRGMSLNGALVKNTGSSVEEFERELKNWIMANQAAVE